MQFEIMSLGRQLRSLKCTTNYYKSTFPEAIRLCNLNCLAKQFLVSEISVHPCLKYSTDFLNKDQSLLQRVKYVLLLLFFLQFVGLCYKQ